VRRVVRGGRAREGGRRSKDEEGREKREKQREEKLVSPLTYLKFPDIDYAFDALDVPD
jgi:hypothetical protein